MRCPECGREMRLSKEESIESFKGSQVRLSYDVYKCDECGSSYVDARSLDEAWKKSLKTAPELFQTGFSDLTQIT